MHFRIGQLHFLMIFCFFSDHIHIVSTRTCGKGWTSYQWSCYYFSTSKVIFKDALSACHLLGAEMLELQNALEEKWIDLQSRLRGYKDVWLGASDIQHEGKYVSVSNAERLQYINWASGQPNNGGGSRNEHCGSYWISNRGMRDAPCKENHNYVCKKRK